MNMLRSTNTPPFNHQKKSSVAVESDKIQNTRNQGCEYAQTPSRSSVSKAPPYPFHHMWWTCLTNLTNSYDCNYYIGCKRSVTMSFLMPQTYHSSAENGISRYGEVNTMAASRIDRPSATGRVNIMTEGQKKEQALGHTLLNGLTSIPVWISHCMPRNVWGEIINHTRLKVYPC